MEEAKRQLFSNLRVQVQDDRVLDAMELVPREEFVPQTIKSEAYSDAPAQIGMGQTISQPRIIAKMISALEPKQGDRVLEVGTGSGYQAAILAGLVAEVVSSERIPSLAESAQKRLVSLGYGSLIKVVLAKKSLGWPEAAPYDGIIVAAGAPKLPGELMDQMAIGGRLIIPVGSADSQELLKVSRSGDSYSVETLGSCRFVPLIGEGAW